MNTPLINLAGLRFGRWIVREPSLEKIHHWICVCDCGTEKPINGASLRAGTSQSCGCANFIHGMSKTSEHAIWRGMLSRCNNPNVKSFKRYGALGIKVCERWQNLFLNFYNDVGPRPSKDHSLDRDNVNGDYEPGNVSWATSFVQANNRRCTRFVIYKGERVSLSTAVRSAGSIVHREAAWIRIKTGWTVDRAVETPSTRESPNSKATRRQAKAMNNRNMAASA
jgi:hypothetical protein